MAALRLRPQVHWLYTAIALCFGLSTIMNVAAECEIISSPRDSCRVDLECDNYQEINFDLNQLVRDTGIIICPLPYRRFRIDNWAGVYLKFNTKFSFPPEILPDFTSENLQFIVELDLENQGYSSAPIIKNLPNLKTLKLNGNSLNEAKLYNVNELPSLRELELSHNMINSFDVQEDSSLYDHLTLLNVSNNYLVNIPDATFYFLTSLEKLDLSQNYIDTLGVLTFEGIKHLKLLDLSSNRITELKLSLVRFSELEELYLDNNRLSKIYAEDFNIMANIKILSMRANRITSIDKNVFSNMLHLWKLDLRYNVIENLDKYSFTGLVKLKYIDLSDNKIKMLPPYLFRGKNLQFLSMVGNALEGHLQKGSFEGLTLMTELDLSYQHLTEVDDYGLFGLDAVTSVLLNNNELVMVSNLSFKSLNQLERLELSNNQITTIQFDTKDLVKLVYLSLKNNSISYIEKNFFTDLTALQFLDLSINNISHITSDSFKTLHIITDLDLSSNPLSGALEGFTFDGLSSLPKLDISHTSLTLIKNEAFKGMEELRELSVSYGKINELETNAFVGATLIEVLDLSFNNITTFMINNTDIVNLKTLYLNNNKLISISSHVFRGLVSLDKLVMANNSLQYIDNDAFGDHSNLQYLDISFNTNLTLNLSVLKNHNNLYNLRLSGIKRYITFTNLKFLGSLTTLVISYCSQINITAIHLRNLTELHNADLSYNNISIVEGSAFYGLENLHELNLSFNKITTINPGVFKDNFRLQKLIISHNSLLFISYGIFRGLRDLSIIDISYNQIKSLKSERFYELKNLNYLIADHNEIDYIGLDEFSNTNLKNLSIGGNPLACDILVKLKDIPKSFHITSSELDHNNENVDGISCYSVYSTNTNKIDAIDGDKSEKILQDIKNILMNLSNGYGVDNEIKTILPNITKLRYGEISETENSFLSNITDILHKENHLLFQNIIDNNQTNYLLNKIVNNTLPTDVYYNPIEKKPKDSNLKTNETLKIDHNIEKRVSELEIQIQHIVKILHTQNNSVKKESLNTNTPNTDKLFLEKQNGARSSIFLETCMGLILFIIICCILFKLYKSRFFLRPGRSMSTREIAHSMDNSNL